MQTQAGEADLPDELISLRGSLDERPKKQSRESGGCAEALTGPGSGQQTSCHHPTEGVEYRA